VFTASSRTELKQWLIDTARADGRVTAAAVLGSGARGAEDLWSDIDFAVRLRPGEDPLSVADSWTDLIAQHEEPVGRMDMWSSGALYRVFLFPDTQQLDVSFWPDDKFAAHGPHFRLLFGEANEPVVPLCPTPEPLISMAWLYALHARSSLARGRTWQALYMINGMRDYVVQLLCLRHDLPVAQGRGVDDLPTAVTELLRPTHPRSMAPADLQHAFAAITALLISEVQNADHPDTARLRSVLNELVRTADSTA
jgi:predicted nucleotidyltransferase